MGTIAGSATTRPTGRRVLGKRKLRGPGLRLLVNERERHALLPGNMEEGPAEAGRELKKLQSERLELEMIRVGSRRRRQWSCLPWA